MPVTESGWINGRMLSWWDGFESMQPGFEMRPNTPFRARLRVTGIVRGRSAARFKLSDADTGECRGEMFMASMMKVLELGVEPGGVIDATWHVVKKGTNYGLEVCDD